LSLEIEPQVDAWERGGTALKKVCKHPNELWPSNTLSSHIHNSIRYKLSAFQKPKYGHLQRTFNESKLTGQKNITLGHVLSSSESGWENGREDR
jgi:hypothetical protein